MVLYTINYKNLKNKSVFPKYFHHLITFDRILKFL